MRFIKEFNFLNSLVYQCLFQCKGNCHIDSVSQDFSGRFLEEGVFSAEKCPKMPQRTEQISGAFEKFLFENMWKTAHVGMLVV
jgi:hypothetical protein